MQVERLFSIHSVSRTDFEVLIISLSSILEVETENGKKQKSQ